MKSLGSPAAVAAAVRDDADLEVERIEAETAAALACLADEEAAEPSVAPDRDARLAAARREARERLAAEDLADAREALEAREAWIRRAVADGARALDAPVPAGERRAALVALAREGLDRLPAGDADIVVAPSDAALLDDAWARELGGGRPLRVVASGAVGAGGCIVRVGGGKVSFDNRRDARARRFEAAWRAALGAIWESAGRRT